MARIDGIIILDPVGKPLITSHFAGHPAAYPAIFTDAFNHARRIGELEPVIWVNSLGGAALCHLERDGLRYLVPLSDEVNPLFAFAFLESFLETLRDYLGEVTEVTVKDNFDIVYMLIEEMLDEGHPMTMETSMLKDIVLPPTLMRKLLTVAGVGLQPQSAPFTAPIPWRRQGVRHAHNEIFFDVEETLDAIVDRQGRVLSQAVWGNISANSKLSGNPDLVLNFGNKVLRECAFHPCVRLPVLEDIVISIYLGASATSVSATPTGDRQPGSTDDKASGRVGGGTVEFDPHSQVMKWSLGSVVSTERHPALTGSFAASSRPTPDPAFGVHFRVANYTFSGLRIDQLKLSGEGYKPFKGVRNSASGRVDVRW